MRHENNSNRRRIVAEYVKIARDATRPAAIIKQGSLRPFKHASILFTAIIETRARLQNDLFALQQALAEFPPYTSRGHGGKHRTKNRQIAGRWAQDRSKYTPHYGAKEQAKAAYRALPVHMRDDVNRVSREVMRRDFEEGVYRRELEEGL